MAPVRESTFLRRALLADAAASGASGLLMALGAAALTGRLGLPEALLREAGLVLLPYAALVAFLGTRAHMPAAAVWAVIACNAIWALDSILLLMGGWVTPTMLGVGFTTAQAAVVGAFAGLQFVGLRRMQATPA